LASETSWRKSTVKFLLFAACLLLTLPACGPVIDSDTSSTGGEESAGEIRDRRGENGNRGENTEDDPVADPEPGDDPVADPEPGDDPILDDEIEQPTPTGLTNFGARCDAVTDCLYGDLDPNVICLGGIPGGYCTISCITHTICGDEAYCGVEAAPGQWFCGLACDNDSQCGRPDELSCDLDQLNPVCTGIPDAVDDPDPDVDPGGGGSDTGWVGDSCTRDRDCAVGDLTDNRCFGDTQGWPSGYCVAYGCRRNADCGSDAFCFLPDTTDAIGLCFQSCTGTCGRSGYDCFGVSETEAVCLPSDLPDPFVDPANVGEPCAISDQCTLGSTDDTPFPLCVPPRWPDGATGLPDGYCTAVDCTLDSSGCGSGATCVVLRADPDDSASSDLYLCMEDCPVIGETTGCRPGYFCYDDGVGSGVCWGE
jgi:hypothetical protein